MTGHDCRGPPPWVSVAFPGFVAPIDLTEENCKYEAVAKVFTTSKFVTSASRAI